MENKSFLMFVSISELFQKVLKLNSDGEFDFKLGECYILICSRDIQTDVARRNVGTNEFISRYENVEFLSNLLPSVSMMEYVSTSGVDTFVELYIERLYDEAQMQDLISICDVVAKRNIPVFIVSSSSEFRTEYPIILKDFIYSEFGLKGYTLEDLEGKPISETVRDIGNREEIIKSIDDHINTFLRNADTEYFLNTLVDDVEKVYRDVLQSKTVEELKEMAQAKLIFVSRRDDKDKIIDKIIKSIINDNQQ